MEIGWQSNSPNVIFPQVLEPLSIIKKKKKCFWRNYSSVLRTLYMDMKRLNITRCAHLCTANESGVGRCACGSRGRAALTDTPFPTPRAWLLVSPRWGTTGRSNQRAPRRQRSLESLLRGPPLGTYKSYALTAGNPCQPVSTALPSRSASRRELRVISRHVLTNVLQVTFH